MKFGFRTPSLKKRISARTSTKRLVQNTFGLKAPKGMGWLTNPKKAAYNKIYNKTTRGCLIVFILPILIVSLFLSINSCSSNIEGPELSKDIEYKITKNAIDKGLDRYLIHVQLNKIIEQESIKKISDYIKTTNSDAQNMIMFFYLKDETHGAWARVDYSPNYSLDLIGVTLEENKVLDTSSSTSITDAEIIGKWKDLTQYSERTLILYSKDEKYFVRWLYKDGSFGDINIKKQNKKFKVDDKEYDEWYIIEDNGNLGTYSSKGKYSEATPI